MEDPRSGYDSMYEIDLASRRIIETMSRYRLVDSSELYIAFSGGKDSIALAQILSRCGIRPKLLSVDMDYNPVWASRIESLAQHFSFEVTILKASSLGMPSSPQPLSSALRLNLEVLSSIPSDNSVPALTPCTPCYNSKVLAMDGFLQSVGVDRIAFAHHATDSAASLVKSALMYIDRWDNKSAAYSPENLRLLTERLTREMTGAAATKPLVERIDGLVHQRLAGTDEPPTQLLQPNSRVRIVRPFFGLWESNIVRLSQHWKISPESSGCGHSSSASTYTAREIVHFECLRVAEPYLAARSQMREWIDTSVDSTGRMLSDTRRRRAELLGDAYKPSVMGVDKL